MAGKLKRKGDVGKAASYISRNQALRKLQISLSNFRRLCIYKGVFPRDVKGKAKYFKKDIAYLTHDHLISFFRQEKIHRNKIKKAKAENGTETVETLKQTKPKLDLTLVIKERFPTFNDALKDLDDALSLVFTFANLPSLKEIPLDLIDSCRKLSNEFLHYVIFSKSLRKVFISIKGFYFQAHLHGNDVTWLIPHNLVQIIPKDVDFKILKSFVEYYTFFLRFVNFHLYKTANVMYPPKFNGGFLKHRDGYGSHQDLADQLLSSLNISLKTTDDDIKTTVELDQFPDIVQQLDSSYLILPTLFKGKTFFLSREVPKQPLVFAIKCCGGNVTWDKHDSFAANVKLPDTSITHHIIDRPLPSLVDINRIYIQPQWIFDSINKRQCLSPESYFIGVELPPHLSPFNSDRHQSLIAQFNNNIAKLDTPSQEPVKKVTPTIVPEQRRLAALALPRQKKKLYDKLMKIKKSKLKEVFLFHQLGTKTVTEKGSS